MEYAADDDKVADLKDFKIKRLIGQGGFGKVFLVEKEGTKEVLAMKAIKKEDIINADMIEACLLEKRILSQTSHQFMVGTRYVF
jgi:serine/threonine protein kinase